MERINTNIYPETADVSENATNDGSRKISVKSHATKVFQNSTIGMVSSIISTNSKYGRFFKVCIMSLCISGFLYQSITYVNHVLEYPTIMDVSVDRPDTLVRPTYTLCTNNL